MKLVARIIMATLLVSSATLAQPATGPQVEDLSNIVARVRTSKGVPGIVALVVRGDQIIAEGADGVRQRGSPELVTLDDQFHLGSCTKAMTATLCAMLVEQGKLKWDSTLEQIFPELREKMLPAYRAVTLEQLLSHHAGVPSGIGGGDWYARICKPGLDPLAGREIILAEIVTHEPEAPPGERWIYSNAGYMIAGHLAEKVTGKTWEDLMRQRIFEPLGMTSAGFGAPGTPGKVDQPRGHGFVGLPVEPGPETGADNPPAIGPAGTVHCSIRDWAKFVSIHLLGERGKSPLLKAESFKKLHTPVLAKHKGELDYALGWCVIDQNLTHDGTNTFWYCQTWLFPDRGTALLVMTNGSLFGSTATEELGHQLKNRFVRGRAATAPAE